MCIKKGHGTYDLFGIDSIKWQYVEDIIKNTCNTYNYKYIRTPVFEETELFHKSIGHATDIISKELYQFKDKGNVKISLRPEGTSGIVRSYVENELYDKESISKFYYLESMFRYEQVEDGRFREFHQFGVEVFNSNSEEIDVEVISLALSIFRKLGLKNVKLHINTLGSYESKLKYKEELKTYFKPYLNDLCEDCKRRYKKNPMRILDCKKDKRKDYIINSPKIEDYLTTEDKNHFDNVIKLLDELNIDYVINRNLVRGLDYYTNTVFEIKTEVDGLGSANTICGGGRYNSLIENLSNKNIPAIGFAVGLERLINVLNLNNLLDFCNKKEIDIEIIKSKNINEDFRLLLKLRDLGYQIDFKAKSTKSKLSLKIYDKYIYIKDNTNNKEYKVKYKNLNDKLNKLLLNNKSI